MAIFDETKTLFAGSGTRMRTVAGKKFSVEIKGAARGNVILQKQIFGALGKPPVLTDFVTVKATEAIPFASVIGRLASGGSSPVDFRVRTGGDFTGNPEFG
jgi:hypothetical protein